VEFTQFLSFYRSDDDDGEDDEQQGQYCVLKPHCVKEIGEFWELKSYEIQDVLIMITSEQQKT
jgi:hypothetical protein